MNPKTVVVSKRDVGWRSEGGLQWLELSRWNALKSNTHYKTNQRRVHVATSCARGVCHSRAEAKTTQL